MRYDLRQMRARITREEERHHEKMRALEEERDELVRAARRGGLPVDAIAAEVGLSVRRVRAILRA